VVLRGRVILDMSDTAQLIKEKLDIAEFIRQYVPLVPAGKNFKGNCPFHKEKTPSFMVSPERGSWHCFGCNIGGDIISFLMKYENIEFIEALKILGEKAGVDVRTKGAMEERRYAVLYDIHRVATDFFKSNLYSDSPLAESARKYLKERGLNNETLELFEIGLSLNYSDALNKHLLKAGFSRSDIERSGLVIKTERGTYWDRFRHRIIFPIHNHFGKVVAFTGRVMPETENDPNVTGIASAKYVNSPETQIYNKSRLLFGLCFAKAAIRDTQSVILVEGQMDLLMVKQDGVQNVVAVSGTALTGEHLANLRKLTDTIVIAFDRDSAGMAATERAIDIAGGLDFSVYVIAPQMFFSEHPEISSSKDPADIARTVPGVFVKIASKPEPAMKYYFRAYFSEAERNNPQGLKRNIRTILSKIKMIQSPVERSQWLGEFSKVSGISEASLNEELAIMPSLNTFAAATPNIQAVKNVENIQKLSRQAAITERLFILALASEECKNRFSLCAPYFSAEYGPLVKAFLGEESSPSVRITAVLDELSMKAGLVSGEQKELLEEFDDLSKQLRGEHFKKQVELIRSRIRNAEVSGDEAALSEALRDFDRASKELYNG